MKLDSQGQRYHAGISPLDTVVAETSSSRLCYVPLQGPRGDEGEPGLPGRDGDPVSCILCL